MGKYRKKPVVVEAELYRPGITMEDGFKRIYREGNEKLYDAWMEAPEGAGPNGDYADMDGAVWVPYIKTLEGDHLITPGDYIITGIKGERYPCKPDIFHATYELVEEGEG